MGKKRVVLIVALVILVILLILSLFSYVSIYGLLSFKGFSDLNLKLFNKNIAINFSDIKKSYPESGLILEVSVLAEIILSCLVIISLRNKKPIVQTVEKQVQDTPERHSRAKTDLDYLYESLRKEGKIKISKIVKSFKISEELALEWCKILESGGLARINYPRMGETELIMGSESVKGDKQDEK